MEKKGVGGHFEASIRACVVDMCGSGVVILLCASTAERKHAPGGLATDGNGTDF